MAAKILVRKLPTFGVGVVAAADILPGEHLWSELPLAAALKMEAKEQDRCPWCFRAAKTCDRQACAQKLLNHSDKFLSRNPGKFHLFIDKHETERRYYPILAARVMGAVMCQAMQYPDRPLFIFSEFNSLAKPVVTAQITHLWQSDYKFFHDCFLSDSPTNAKVFSVDWFIQTMAILQINTFGVVLDNLNCASALYLQASRFNHACDPNAEFTWNLSHEAHVLARRPIKAGEQIFVSYLGSQSLTTDERRKYLFNNYGFWCACSLCQIKAR